MSFIEILRDFKRSIFQAMISICQKSWFKSSFFHIDGLKHLGMSFHSSLSILTHADFTKNTSLISAMSFSFDMSRKKTFYVLMISGIAFIVIGVASLIDSNIPRKVELDKTLDPNINYIDVVTPIMNKGNMGKIIINGSEFDFKIDSPDNTVIVSVTNRSHYEYDLVANNEGQYRIETKNTGNSTLQIDGDVETKASPLAFGAHMMLLITGVIVLGIGIKARYA